MASLSRILLWQPMRVAALLLAIALPACVVMAATTSDNVASEATDSRHSARAPGQLSRLDNLDQQATWPALYAPGPTTTESPTWIRDDNESWIQRSPAQQAHATLAGEHLQSQTVQGQTALHPARDYTTTLTEARLTGQLQGQGMWAEGLLRVSRHQWLDTPSAWQSAALHTAGMPAANDLGTVAGGIQLSYLSEDKLWAVGGQWLGQWQADSQPNMARKPPAADMATLANMSPPPAAMPITPMAAPNPAPSWRDIRWRSQYFAELQLTGQTRLRASIHLNSSALQGDAITMQPKLSLQHDLSPHCRLTARIEGAPAANSAPVQASNGPRYLVNLSYQLTPAASMAAELSNTGMAAQRPGTQTGTAANGPTLNTTYTLYF